MPNQARTGYLLAARSALPLLRDPAVTARWAAASALAGFRVSGLAGHLAAQVFHVERLLDTAAPDGEPIALLEHYRRSQWVGTEVDDDVSVGIRQAGEDTAAEGPAALAERAEAALATLDVRLAAEPAGRVVHLPWGPWSLTLDDFLRTRTMEIAVHSDDLAVSAGITAPELPGPALGPVLDLLSRLAVERYGQAAVLRALSRAERAPASIAAI